MSDINVGDVGVPIRITPIFPDGVTIDNLVSAKILYKKTNGISSGYFNAGKEGSDLVYTVEAGDIDVAGNWQIQVEGTFSDGKIQTTKNYVTMSVGGRVYNGVVS